jgi:hypothetical protein
MHSFLVEKYAAKDPDHFSLMTKNPLSRKLMGNVGLLIGTSKLKPDKRYLESLPGCAKHNNRREEIIAKINRLFWRGF